MENQHNGIHFAGFVAAVVVYLIVGSMLDINFSEDYEIIPLLSAASAAGLVEALFLEEMQRPASALIAGSLGYIVLHAVLGYSMTGNGAFQFTCLVGAFIALGVLFYPSLNVNPLHALRQVLRRPAKLGGSQPLFKRSAKKGGIEDLIGLLNVSNGAEALNVMSEALDKANPTQHEQLISAFNAGDAQGVFSIIEAINANPKEE